MSDMTAAEYRANARSLLRAAEEQQGVTRDATVGRMVAQAAVWAQLATSAAISEGQVPRGDCRECQATDVPVTARYHGDTRLTYCAGGCR